MTSSRSLLASATAIALVASIASAAAAQDQAGQDASTVGELVVTGGSQVRLPSAYAGDQVARGARVGLFGALDAMDTPFAITSYTENLIRNQQARSVADVLQNDPSVRVAKGFGNFQELYVIRGFPVFSDDMTYNGVYGVLPRQFVAAELLERVEVLHGANAFLNGAAPGGSGVGGAFNLVPKRAGSEPLNRITLGAETGGQLYAAGDVARRFGPTGEFGVRANLVRRDGETAVDDQDRKLTMASLGVDYAGETVRFSADAGLQDHRIDQPRPNVTPSGAVPRPPKASSNFAQPWTYTDERQFFGVVRGEVDFTDHVSGWIAAGGRSGREKNVLSNPNSTPAGVTSAYRFDNRRKDSVLSADAGLRADLATGAVRHRLTGSVSAVRIKSRNAYAFSNFAGFPGSLYAPVGVAAPTPDFFVGGTLSDPNVTERTRNQSAAVADLMTFFDGKVLATVGVRWQEIYTRTYDYNSGAQASRYKADAWTPAFALVVKPSEQVSIYGNYAESLIPGQVAPATSGGVPVTNVGEVLAPFRGKQYEVGVKWDGGRFGSTLSAFSVTMPSAYVANNVFAANGRQRHRGVELSVFGEPTDGVRLIGGATVLDPELKRTAGGLLDGADPIGVPKFSATLNAEWDPPAVPGLTLEGRIVHSGKSKADAANLHDLKSWTRADLGARYVFRAADREITLRGRVENVAGKDYWASSGGYPGANYLVLGNPRTFVLSASVDF